MKYCACKNPIPEEIKRGVIICLECNLEMELPDEQPEDDSGDYDRDITHDEALKIDQHEQEKAQS